jgi:lipopolysaccharide/colanic/teichoic acid biosynthesis glycosyltransferase
VPWLSRGTLLPGRLGEAASLNSLIANSAAIFLAFWMRLSIETYPGVTRAYVLLLSASTAHILALIWFLLARTPYDRVQLVSGYVIHVLCLYAILILTEFRRRRRIAVVPFGRVNLLADINSIDWHILSRPRLGDARNCQAIVADFSANLPQEWEAFLAKAALARRIVYQVKQLSEALTGRVALEQLSENSFGMLVPARGYFYFKSAVDIAFALILLPLLLPVMAIVAIAIRLDSPGGALFRQTRIGYAGREITVYKFRSMITRTVVDERDDAMTAPDDDRITRVGKVLRKFRLDELPQVINIIRGEMSWIGPRPEARVLSVWYRKELPFYDYRHVVKPGISGWAQVNQGHVADVQQVHSKLQYDFYYIKYFSPWLDVLIFVRTLKTVLTGFGSR